jgi:tetratricopeptide (TPR) repeat protein
LYILHGRNDLSQKGIWRFNQHHVTPASVYTLESYGTQSPTGKWQTQVSESFLGNHFFIDEHKALLIIDGKEYPFPVSEPQFSGSVRLQELDIFNPTNPKAISLKDLGYLPTKNDYVFNFKESVPFEKMIDLDRFSRFLILVGSEPYLLMRLPMTSDNFKTPPTHYDRAWTLLYEGHYPEALQEFKEVLKEDPNNAGAYYGWARALEGPGTYKDRDSRWDFETKLLKKVIQLTPENKKEPINNNMPTLHMTIYQAALRMIEEIQIMRSHENDSEI